MTPLGSDNKFINFKFELRAADLFLFCFISFEASYLYWISPGSF